MPYRRCFSTQFFQELTGTQRKTTLAMLGRFTDLGYCIRGSRRDAWIKQKQPVPLVTEIVAVEAKLDDWCRALRQAYRHLDFAHRSCVLLDANRASPGIRNLAAFKRLNIGLITLRSSGHPRVWFSPAKGTPRSSLKYWQANAEFGKHLRF